MKQQPVFFIIIIQTILIGSCKKEQVSYTLDEFIQAGQKASAGVEYIDLEPDINCRIINPWQKTDTTIMLDLNKDGINDFVINGVMCHPSMLGADCENLSITPLLNNEICVNKTTNWLDTIPHADTIYSGSNWSNTEALIYSYYWQMGDNSSTKGYWKEVSESNRYFIGYKILKEDKTFYGWIGMKRDPTTWSFSFLLTDYAILKEYEE